VGTTMNALVWIAVEPRTDADRENLASGLTALAAADPSISFNTDPMFGDTIIGATWEGHLEVILDRLKREFHVEASVAEAVRDCVTGARCGRIRRLTGFELQGENQAQAAVYVGQQRAADAPRALR